MGLGLGTGAGQGKGWVFFTVVAWLRCPPEDAVFHLGAARVGLVLVHTAQLSQAWVGGRVADDLHLVRLRVRLRVRLGVRVRVRVKVRARVRVGRG